MTRPGRLLLGDIHAPWPGARVSRGLSRPWLGAGFSALGILDNRDVETIPLAERPDLSPVFGPLQEALLLEIWRLTDEASDVLVAAASELGVRAGWSGKGVHLDLSPSGQAFLSTFLEPTWASFTLELAPIGSRTSATDGPLTSRYGVYQPGCGWVVEGDVYVDCDHPRDCGGMHLIREFRNEEAVQPVAAVRLFLAGAHDLVALARAGNLAGQGLEG